MKQNFAGQPDGGGALGHAGPFPSLTGLDLMSDVTPNQSTIFRPYPRFVDNCKTKKCMKNASGMKNFDDDNNYDLFDIFTTGGDIYRESMRNKSAEEQARLALQIQQQRAAQAKAEADAKKAEAGSIAGKIKAYTVPLIVVGVLTIGGIGAYFYFKKKKIS